MATTYYVSGNGSDTANTGLSPTSAYQNIQTAINKMVSGDTLYLLAGTYTRSGGYIGAISGLSNISILRYQSQTPVLQITNGNWSALSINGCTNVVIDGLTIIGTSAAVSPSYAAAGANNTTDPITGHSGITVTYNGTLNSSHVIVRNCTISNCSAAGMQFVQVDYLTILNNTVYGCCNWSPGNPQAILISQLANYDSGAGYRITCQKNIVHNNQSKIASVNTGRISEGHGITIYNGYDSAGNQYNGKILIAENICYSNGKEGIFCFTGATQVDVVNNTLYQNGIDFTTSGSPESDLCFYNWTHANGCNNIIYALTGNPCNKISYSIDITLDRTLAYNGAFVAADIPFPIGLVNIIGQDPKFVSPSTGNFALQAGSPAVDNGSSAYDAYLTTAPYNGDGVGATPQRDIGALEYTGTPTPTPTIILITSTPSVITTTTTRTVIDSQYTIGYVAV